MCFWGGGYKYKTQHFNKTVAQTSASLLFISVASLLIPAAFVGSIHSANSESSADLTSDILAISRATAIILLILYFSYLLFQVRNQRNISSFFLELWLINLEQKKAKIFLCYNISF